MNKYLIGALAVIVVAGAGWWFFGNKEEQMPNAGVSEALSKTVESEKQNISFKVPADWEEVQYEDSVKVNPIEMGMGNSAMIVRTKFHTSVGWTYQGETVDGSAESFAKWRALPDGSSESKDQYNQSRSQVKKNVTIDGVDGISLFTMTTDGYREDLYWMHQGDKNWFITVYNYNNLKYDDTFESIIASIELR